MATVSVKLLDAAPPLPLPTPAFLSRQFKAFCSFQSLTMRKTRMRNEGMFSYAIVPIKSSSCLAKENLFDDILTGRTLLFCFKYNK